MGTKSRWIAVVFGTVGCVSGVAHASFTPIQSPPHGEANQAQILSEVYGGTFSADGHDFTNGSIRAVRIDDAQDALVFSGQFFVRAVAKFADRAEAFGVTGGVGDLTPHYHKLFEVQGSGYDVSGSRTEDNMNIRWAMKGSSAVYSTDASLNPKHHDAEVTYRVDGVSDNLLEYMLFWENLNADEPAGTKTRSDFNDLVVEVFQRSGSSATSVTNAAPLPAGIWPGSALLGGLLLWRSRRRLRIA
jgi:hypothetical protein